MRKFEKSPLTNSHRNCIIQKLSDSTIAYGGIAQLGERLNGIQEVSGSIPLISTKHSSGNSVFPELFCLLIHVFTSKIVISQTCLEIGIANCEALS